MCQDRLWAHTQEETVENLTPFRPQEAIENEGRDRTGADALELPGQQLALAQA